MKLLAKYDPSELTGMNPFCVEQKYNLFSNCIESTRFRTFLYEVKNVKTSSQQLMSDFCQMHQHKTYCLTTYSRQTHPPPNPTIGTTISSFAFLATRVATIRTFFQFCLQCMNSALVQSSMTDIGYYIE
jgi:hypothetical protein